MDSGLEDRDALSCAGMTEADDINSIRISSDCDHVTARKSCSGSKSCVGDGVPTNGGWHACQQWLACLPTMVGAPANVGWQVR
jgi:hypothetical protein